jgi:hypothetical protein
VTHTVAAKEKPKIVLSTEEWLLEHREEQVPYIGAGSFCRLTTYRLGIVRKPTTAETMYPAPKSTMICDGPQSRLTKSTDAVIATESLHRFTGSLLKTLLIAASRKFSFGSWNQWAISKDTFCHSKRERMKLASRGEGIGRSISRLWSPERRRRWRSCTLSISDP